MIAKSAPLLTAALLAFALVGFSPSAHAANVLVPATQDNTLYESGIGATSNGSGDFIFAGATNGSALRRALLQFDVAASVPAGATITGATLTLQMSKTRSGAEDMSLSRVTQAWGEGTSDATGNEGQGIATTAGDANWIGTGVGAINWTTAGGDFNPIASATTSVSGIGSYNWSSVQLIADVQDMLDNSAGDFGWILTGNEATNATAKRFNSRENSSGAPVLSIDFIPEPSAALLLLAAAAALGSLSRRRRV